MTKHANDLTPQEMALVVLRHEGFEAVLDKHGKCRVDLPDHTRMLYFHDEYKISYKTIGPLWQRDKARVIERMVRDESHRIQNVSVIKQAGCVASESPLAIALSWYSRATLEDITRVLIDYWYVDGVEI